MLFNFWRDRQNTDTIFDDPDLFNVEFDTVTTAMGSGHGFIERPWSWDGQRLNTEVPANSYKFYDNTPAFGPSSKKVKLSLLVEQAPLQSMEKPLLARRLIRCFLGDRITEIKVSSKRSLFDGSNHRLEPKSPAGENRF